jgi:hypothetical protein
MKLETVIKYHEDKLHKINAALSYHHERLEIVKSETACILTMAESEVVEKYHNDLIEEMEHNQMQVTSFLANTPIVPCPYLVEKQVGRIADLLLGKRLPLDVDLCQCKIIPAGTKITKPLIYLMVRAWYYNQLRIEPSPVQRRVLESLATTHDRYVKNKTPNK